MINHKGSRTIETKRTIMRKFEISDSECMFKNWASDEEVARYLTWKAHSNIKVTKDVMDTWCAHYNENTYHWALVLKETNEPIGSIGIVRLNEEEGHGEFGYAISKEHWNKGIVTEAMSALLEYFFNEIGFETIEGLHDVNNPASGKVMQKLGMDYVEKIEGQFNDNKGNPIDVFKYAICKEKYNTLNIRKAYRHEVDVVAELYENLINHMDSTINYTGWRVGIYPTIEEAQNGFSEDSLYVATIGGKIVGSCILNNEQSEPYLTAKWQIKTDKPLVVHTLAVNPDFLNRGIARKLLSFADEVAIKEGIHSIRLDTSQPNLPARRLYEKVGYTHVDNIDLLLNRGGIKCWYTFEKIV